MEKFGQIMAMILLAIPVAIINGFVFCKQWVWFIVPTFEIQPLRIIEAIGIMFLLNFVSAEAPKKSDVSYSFGYRISSRIIYALLVLFFGWIGSQFM